MSGKTSALVSESDSNSNSKPSSNAPCPIPLAASEYADSLNLNHRQGGFPCLECAEDAVERFKEEQARQEAEKPAAEAGAGKLIGDPKFFDRKPPPHLAKTIAGLKRTVAEASTLVESDDGGKKDEDRKED